MVSPIGQTITYIHTCIGLISNDSNVSECSFFGFLAAKNCWSASLLACPVYCYPYIVLIPHVQLTKNFLCLAVTGTESAVQSEVIYKEYEGPSNRKYDPLKWSTMICLLLIVLASYIPELCHLASFHGELYWRYLPILPFR